MRYSLALRPLLLVLLLVGGAAAQNGSAIKTPDGQEIGTIFTNQELERAKTALAELGEAAEDEAEAKKERRRRLAERIAIFTAATEHLRTLGGYDAKLDALKKREASLRDDIERAKAAVAQLSAPARSEVTKENRDRLGAEAQQLEATRKKKDEETERLTGALRENAEASTQLPETIQSTTQRRAEIAKRLKELGEGAPPEEVTSLTAFDKALDVRLGVLQSREANKTKLGELIQERLTVAQLERDLAREDLTLLNDRLALLDLALERRASDMAAEERARVEQLQQEIKEAEPSGQRARLRLDLITRELSAFQFEVEAELSRQKGRNASLEQRAVNAENRLKTIRESFPEGERFEEWKRNALERKLEQSVRRSEDFAAKTERERPRLREVRDRAVSGRDRLNGLLDLMDEVARDPEQLDEAVALDEDGMAGKWLIAAREHEASVQKIERLAQKLLANRDWEETNEALRERATAFSTRLTELEEAAALGLEQTDCVEAALEESRSHLEGVRFWLREPSLFSRATFDRAVEEAAALPAHLEAIPGSSESAWSSLRDGPPRGRDLGWRIAATLGLGLLGGLGLRTVFARQARRTPPPPPPSLDEEEEEEVRRSAAEEHEREARRAAQRRGFFETLAAFAIPAGLIAGLQTFAHGIRPDHASLGVFASIVTGFVVWRLVVSLEKTLLTADAQGACTLGCDQDTARTLRRTLGRVARAGCLLLPLATVLDALEMSRWADLARWAFGAQALVVGIWLIFRRDLIDVLVPRETSSVVALAFRSVAVYLLPVVLLGFGAVIVLQMMGYRNAGTFYLGRTLLAVVTLLVAGLIFQVTSVTIRRRLLDESGTDPRESGSEEEKDRRERRRLIVRLATFAAFVLVAGATLTVLSWLLGIGLQAWRRVGAFELISGDGSEDAFRLAIGDIARAGIIFTVGLFTARIVRDALALTLKKRQMARGSRYVVRTLVFYSMVALAAILALSSLGVRLGQLGWLLGAAGIGIGFGLQEIISNFIAGLILFFERPVQVGDIVSVGDVEGDVEKISIRATVVRTRDGISIILPNKRLITDDVINWSHGDQRTRLRLQVGVAYGSDVELVKKTLVEVMEKERRVMRFPKPEVQFLSFGESELSFELYLWLASPDITLRRRVRSDVNAAIDAAFRERGIEIPFPQRDLHLRASDGVLRIDDQPTGDAEEAGA